MLRRIGEVPAAIDADDSRILASFEVALTPTSEDAGSAPTLVKDIILTAIDANTQARVSASAPDFSTDLTLDKKSAGKGKVVE